MKRPEKGRKVVSSYLQRGLGVRVGIDKNELYKRDRLEKLRGVTIIDKVLVIEILNRSRMRCIDFTVVLSLN